MRRLGANGRLNAAFNRGPVTNFARRPASGSGGRASGGGVGGIRRASAFQASVSGS